MNDLQHFIQHAEQEAKDYAAEKDTRVTQQGVTHVVRDDKMRPFSAADAGDPKRWYRLSQRLPIPEVDQRERSSFLEWRRALAGIEEREGVLMTPFERNLEVWRQLWRVVERSDVVMMIVDARNPLAFRSKGCEEMVLRAKKHLVLLLNKAELLTPKQRRAWGRSFHKEGITALFFSAQRAKEELEGADAGKGRVGDEAEAEPDIDRVADDQQMLEDEEE
eukprot:gene2678-13817_t